MIICVLHPPALTYGERVGERVRARALRMRGRLDFVRLASERLVRRHRCRHRRRGYAIL